MLKRLLSAILTTAMLLSFIPTVFATEAETAANADITIIYDIGKSTTATDSEPTPTDASTDYYNKVSINYIGTDSTTKKNITTFTDWSMTNGFWKYAGHTTTTIPATYYGAWNVSETTIGKLIAFSFYVPVAGEYNVIASGRRQNSTHQSQSLAYQVFPAGTSMSDIETAMAGVALNSEGTGADGNPLGCWLHGSSANARGAYNFETAGEYIIVFKNIEIFVHSTSTNSHQNSFTINHFTLSATTSTDGVTKSVPMGHTTLTSDSIEMSETTTVEVSSLYGSADWKTYDTTDSTITYVSSDTKVATVAADGTVKGVGAGTAEISAVVDGATLVSAPITVTAPTVKLVYDIGSLYTSSIDSQDETDYAKEIATAFNGNDKNTTQLNLKSEFEDYKKSNGLWRYIGHSSASNPKTFYGCWLADSAAIGDWVAIGISVPVAGVYDVTLTGYRNNSSNNSCDFAYRIFPAGTTTETIETEMKDVKFDEDNTKVEGTYLGWRECSQLDTSPNVHEDVTFEKAGEYVFVVKAIGVGRGTLVNKLILDYITLTQPDETGILPIGYTKLSSDEISVGTTAQASISDKLYNANNWMTYDTTDSTITYVSSDSDVAEVSADGTVTAKAVGTAEITAIVDGAQLASAELTVEKAKISLAYTTSVDENGDITVAAYDAGSVTVNAPVKTGYTFSHWVRGTAANGVWVSADTSYTFDLVSPTYLTAMYVAEDTKIVEFFNGNGELLAQKTVGEDGTVEVPEDPSMVGFSFLNWILGKNGDEVIPFESKNITESLRVAANYKVEETKYTVGDETDLVYDDEVIKTADSADTRWLRDGKPVGYGKAYTYNVWADATITAEEYTGEKIPLVYIDPTVKSVDTEKACMIEFDGAGKEIVEAGILFSVSGTPEVGSCMYKATSKTNGGEDGHGQLTAKPANSTQTVARGYIIYLDNGEYKTAYSEVLNLN